jgi:CheY-like chemotaxis protein
MGDTGIFMEQLSPRSRRRRAAESDLAFGGAREGTKRSKPRALVIEADPASQRICRKALEASGFIVDAVDRGIAAVVAARAALPDLILVDLELPDVPGREAIGWLRSNPALRSTSVVVLVLNEKNPDVAAIKPSATLRKPLTSLAVRRTIQKVLSTSPG